MTAPPDFTALQEHLKAHAEDLRDASLEIADEDIRGIMLEAAADCENVAAALVAAYQQGLEAQIDNEPTI